MWRLVLLVCVALANAQDFNPQTRDELVATVVSNCLDMGCVKQNVLTYLDNVLKIKSDGSRDLKNIDAAIFKRVARVFKTHELRYKLPEMLFGDSEVVYNPKNGLDVVADESQPEARGLLLKKKLLFPLLLLLKLKFKALLPIFVALIGLKAFKALILSKLAIVIVVGFIAYQFFTKSGAALPVMTPATEAPASVYGAPGASTAAPDSYQPSWEPSGPYSRVWNPSSGNNDAQSMAYSAYYPGASSVGSSTTARP